MGQETPEDLKREQAVAEEVGKHWGLRLEKLSDSLYHIDRALVYGEHVLGWAEIKCRNRDRTTYTTFMMDFKKWMTGIDLYRTTNLPFVIVAKFTDGIWFYSYDELTKAYLRWGGRKDRGLQFDMEPVVHIPFGEFRRVIGKRAKKGSPTEEIIRVPKHVENNLAYAKRMPKENRRGKK